MTPWMRKLHKWVGLLIALQFLLWMSSGVVMSQLDAHKVHGGQFRVKPAAPPAWPGTAVAIDALLAHSTRPVTSISSGWLLDLPVYRLANDSAAWLVNARNGQGVALDAALAARIAQASYSGGGQAGAARLLDSSSEARGHKGRVWRVDFSDAEGTTVYVSDRTGAVLEHRNDAWRVFDFFWMLHIMDYAERTNFNNPLLVSAAVGGVWMALTGVWLLFASIRLAEFIPARWRRTRRLHVCGENGSKFGQLEAPAGATVFEALARHGLPLPSNCGGGQSCGLCAVRCAGTPPEPTAAERAMLPADKLSAGYRLACSLPVEAGLELYVPSASLASEVRGTVTRVDPVTPFLREIAIRPDSQVDYRPGAYIQVHVPRYERAATQIVLPEHHLGDWAAVSLPARLGNETEVRRSYSLTLPSERSDGQLALLVRYIAGERPGRGSTYLYTLAVGDEVRLSGPFGDFALRPGVRQKVFIGGGAGMAPLRAMIHALLDGGAGEPVHFWYGARTLRDAPYVAEMSALAAAHPNFSWHLVLSEEAQPVPGARAGLVHEVAGAALARLGGDLGQCDFYLCGPPAMLAATRQMLRDLGVSDAYIAYDDFKV